ncbi:helix-turn-helix domain-containing protein [Actinocorallia populi]|uniref:helix-turn-helix domain-containing protein n=1 Tax=Actinocorallia populi TaxID=2079200 RepID=UPI0018E4E748|nr:AraC family transcriptional regulator [Actinocorallia populi]
MSLSGHFGADPDWCEGYGYGLGKPDGIHVLKYRSARTLEFGEARDDFLHQLYWSPDGLLGTLAGTDGRFVGPGEAFWVRKAVSHEVSGGAGQTTYRVSLREIPRALRDVRVAAVSVSAEAARLIQFIASPGVAEAEALEARVRIMEGLGATTREFAGHHADGRGLAMVVARSLTREPADPTRLEEWAVRLCTSVKTLQRDFECEFGMSYTQWRTRLRLQVARVLLKGSQPVTQVAHQVGYASPSAFIQAFSKEYGHTPGAYVRLR